MRYAFILLLVLVVYALVDCIRADDADMPSGLPKAVWVVLIIVFPGAGAIAWLVVSRVTRHAQRPATAGPSPYGAPTRPRPAARRPVTRQVAPDDDPEFLASLDRPRPRDKDRQDDEPGPSAQGPETPEQDTPSREADDDAGSSDDDGGPGTRH